MEWKYQVNATHAGDEPKARLEASDEQRKIGVTAIGDICKRDVVFITTRSTTIQAAAKLMRHYHVGTLVVIDEMDGRRVPAGILTDGDIVIGINALDLDPKAITVGDIMSPELVTVREDEGLVQTVKIMRCKGVRRLPVVDREGGLAGIFSIDDLLEALAEQMTEMARIFGREREHEVQNRR
jgi:predicted transcriptional regulator